MHISHGDLIDLVPIVVLSAGVSLGVGCKFGKNRIEQVDILKYSSLMKLLVLLLLALCFSPFSSRLSRSISTPRPPIVHIGVLFSYNSTIGRVAKVAIDAAVSDVNADPSVLHGTKLVLEMQDYNCNSFIGVVQALQFMETDIVAVIGPQSSQLAHVISHVANELQVPLLSFSATDPTLSSLQYPFFVRTTHSDLFQMAAVAELVDYYQWSQVIVVFTDDDHGRNGITSLANKLSEKRNKISYKAALPPGATRTDIMNLLVTVGLMAPRIIILHVSPVVGVKVLSTASYLGMMSDGYVWIATDWLSSLLDSSAPLDSTIMDTMQGVVVLRTHTPVSELKDTLILRWSQLMKNDTTDDFRLNSFGLYAYDTVWLISHALEAFFNDGGVISFSNDSKLHDAGGNLHLDAMSVFDGGPMLLNKILNTNFNGLTGNVQFDTEKNLVHPSYDILNVVGTGWRTIGYWTDSSGLSIDPPERLNTRQANTSRPYGKLSSVIWPGEKISKPRGWVFPNNGKELKIGVPYRVSFRQFVSVASDGQAVKGYCIDVFIAAIHLLPYPVPFKFIPFGDGLQNPSYSKLSEMVASGEFDAAVGDMAIVTNRTKMVDFTLPYIDSGLVVVVPAKRLNSDAWAFLQPFTLKMWCLIGLFLLIVGAVIWILEHRINDEFRGPPKQQIVTIFWFSFSTLFLAHRENTMSTMGRLVLIIWLFVVLIIQSSYTATLTSILTVQHLTSPIQGISSLLNSDEPIGFQVGSFAANYLVEELGISRSRLVALDTPKDYIRALELGPNNGGVAAVVDERSYIELFLSIQCKFVIVGSEFARNGWGFAFPRDSPLAVDLSTAILTLAENGDLQRIHNKWLSASVCSSQATEIESERLELSSFWGLFLICGIACTACLLVFFILAIRQYIRHYPLEESDTSSHGRSRSGQILQRFLSFIDEKEEEVKKRSKMRKMQQDESNKGSQSTSNPNQNSPFGFSATSP